LPLARGAPVRCPLVSDTDVALGNFLDDLLCDARRRVDEACARESLDDVRRRGTERDPVPGFRRALGVPGVAVIAEIKRASPSKGELAPGMDALDQGLLYVEAGVAAISVLTEPDRFKGSLDDLQAVAALGTPCLRKDFTVDRYQIWEALDRGASAVLLIVAALDDADLRDLHDEATAAGLDVLVEVHDQAELQRALRIEPAIVGVNARNLRSFEVDRDAFARLRPNIPDGILAVAESGVRGPDDVLAAGEQGADAVLVGETLVTANDPRAMATSLVAAGRAAGLPANDDESTSHE
jgi:indole-3-glycerol phosphate synthase